MRAPIRAATSGLRELLLSDANFYYSNTTIKKRERTIDFLGGMTICFPSSAALLLAKTRQCTNQPLPFLISSRGSVIFLLSVSLVYTDFCQNGDEGWKRSPLGLQHRMLTDEECFLLLCHRRVIRGVFFSFSSLFSRPSSSFCLDNHQHIHHACNMACKTERFQNPLALSHGSICWRARKKRLERWDNTLKVTGWTICLSHARRPIRFVTVQHFNLLYVLELGKPVRSTVFHWEQPWVLFFKLKMYLDKTVNSD